MQDSNIPTKVDIIWARDAGASYVRPIPDTVQQPTLPFAASYPTGFPPDTFLAPGAGGEGPDGRDMNGILQQLSAWVQWLSAGGPTAYDGTFQSEIGGYPNGAIVASATTSGIYWLSTADNNTTNPDSSGTGWVNVMSEQAAAAGFVVSLGLTGYIKFPTWLGGWMVQWGSTNTIVSGSNATITFPATFPTAVYQGFLTAGFGFNLTAATGAAIGSVTTSGMVATAFGQNSGYSWLAIGK